MKTSMKREMDKTYFTVELDADYVDDYQIEMVTRNRIPGLISITRRGEDLRDCYDYDISGMISLKAMFEKTTMQAEDIRQLTEEIIQTAKEVQLYLLDAGKILLEPEYIFYQMGKYLFCYLPSHPGNFQEDFHELTEYMVDRTDYQDETATKIAYELHKLTMMPGYRTQQVEAKIKEIEEEQKALVEEMECGEELWGREQWQEEDCERIGAVPSDHPLQKLTVPQFLKRKKKYRWGNWNELIAMEGKDL